MPHALKFIDTPGALFFLGILMGVGALQGAGLLTELSKGLVPLPSVRARQPCGG